MDLKEFEDMVNRHDLTYDYSDDGSVWRAGLASENRIKAAAKLLPIEDVKRIWNAKVDKMFIEEARKLFAERRAMRRSKKKKHLIKGVR